MGVTNVKKVPIFTATLTIILDKVFGLNRSLDSPSLARLISVSETYLDFFDNHKVATITPPEINSNKVGVGTLLESISMLNSVAGTPDRVHAS